jgi:hypothetical protein
MRITVVYPRLDAIPRWQMVLAAFMAIAVGAGLFVFVWRSAERSAASALLSFDPAAAAANDTAIAHVSQPAIAVAQSMLTEATVLDLLRHAGITPSDPSVGIGEFRSRIELDEPSARTLRVLYREPDPRRSRAVANAIAAALAAWTPPAPLPSGSGPAAASQSAIPQPVAPAKSDSHHPGPESSVFAALANLEAKLAATNEKLADLSSHPTASPVPAPTPAQPNTPQAEQRRNLEAQLAAARQKLNDLRVRYTDEYPDVQTALDNIAELQHELADLPPPASSSSQDTKSSEAPRQDREIAQLRLERDHLNNQIAAEERTAARLRAHPAVSETVPPAEPASAPPAPPAPAVPTSLAAPASATVVIPVWQNPFRIARLASLTPRSLAWPTVLASMLCALFYAAATFGLFLYLRREMQAAHPTPAVQAETALAMVPSVPVAEQPPAPAPYAAREPEWRWTSAALIPEHVESIAPSEPTLQSTPAEPLESSLETAVEPINLSPTDAQPGAASEPEPVWSEPEPQPAPEPEPAAEPARLNQQSISEQEESKADRNSGADPNSADAEWNEKFLKALALDRKKKFEAEPRGNPSHPPARTPPPVAPHAAETHASDRRPQQETSSVPMQPPRSNDTLRLGSFTRRR